MNLPPVLKPIVAGTLIAVLLSQSACSVNGMFGFDDAEPKGTVKSGDHSLDTPTLSGVSPSVGSPLGGTLLSLGGTGFLAGATVTIGGTQCTSIIVVSSTLITCIAGVHAAGIFDIVVTNPNGRTSTFSKAYTYIGNALPTISAILDHYTNANTASSAISFTIADADSTMACSSAYLSLATVNPALVQMNGIVWGGAYPNCNVVITPVTNAVGTAGLTITIADTAGGRASRNFNLRIFSTNSGSSFVLGQVSSTSHSGLEKGMNTPISPYAAGGKFFVTDSTNHRVLIWNTVPTNSEQAADFALGQPDLSYNRENYGGVSASTLQAPTCVYSVGTKLFVVDTSTNRVLVWNTMPDHSGEPADFVLGQPDLTSNTINNGGVSGASMKYPAGVSGDGTKLFVADGGNHRVLVWNSIPDHSGQIADFALGQPDLNSNSANNGGVSASSVNYPSGVYSDGAKLFVTDTLNHRILVWNSIPDHTGQPANFALGQPDLISNIINNGGVSAMSLQTPGGVYRDGTNFFVADTGNHRVLMWSTIPDHSGQSANFALGQPDLVSNAFNNGGISASSMRSPERVFSEGTKLFIADYNNNRVLVWNTIPTSTGQAADYAIGQPNLASSIENNGRELSGWTMNSPYGVYSDGTKLFVADNNNNRVLVWNTIPTSPVQVADFALGQPDLTSNTTNNGGLSGSSMNHPSAVFRLGTKLFVVDSSNHRVLVWNTIPNHSGQSADFALGQPDLATNVPNPKGASSFPQVSASSMSSPTGVSSDGIKLFVTDSHNHRVLVWNTIPDHSGQAANFVLGQPSMTTNNSGSTNASSMDFPSQVHCDGGKLFVADTFNNRVLFWNTIPDHSGQPANFALGQPDLTSRTANNGGVSGSSMKYPVGIYSTGTRLFVADSENHRLLVWNSIPSNSGQAATFAMGQPNLTSNSSDNGGRTSNSMNTPMGVYVDSTRLIIGDFRNSRVLLNPLP